MTMNHRRALLHLPLLALALYLSSRSALAVSVWSTPTGGSWLDSTKWTGPVPNAPGDVAQLATTSPRLVTITIPSEVTVGQLNIAGLSTFTLSGAGPLVFDNPGDDQAALHVTNHPLTHTISAPIRIADGEQLNIDINSGSQLNLTGSLLASTGGVAKSGTGVLQLLTSNSAWNGAITVSGGEVLVNHANALGTASGAAADGIRINTAGTLRFNLIAATAANEHIQFDGGTLLDRVISGQGNTFGRINLLSNGGTIRQNPPNASGFQPTLLTGPIDGSGNLTLAGHFTLSGTNSYTGQTILAPDSNSTVLVTNAAALGTADGGTVVNGNLLRLDVSAAEPIRLNGGSAQWRTNSQNWSGPVQLEGGTMQLLATQQTFNFPVTLAGSASLVTSTSARATWAGTVGGTGNLTIGNGLTVTGRIGHDGKLTLENGAALNSANSYTGETLIRQGDTDVNHALAFGSSSAPVIVDGQNANLRLNQTVGKDITLRRGTVFFNDTADAYSNTLRLERGLAFAEGMTLASNVVLANDGVPAEVGIIGGIVSGPISGVGKLRLGTNSATQIISGENDYRGITVLVGGVRAMSPTAFGDTSDGTVVDHGISEINATTSESFLIQDNGQLRLKAQLPKLPMLTHNNTSGARIEIAVPSTYDQRVDVGGGTIELRAATTLGQVVVHSGGTLLVGEGGSLQVTNNAITMIGGTIDGSVGGLQSVTKIGNGEATLEGQRNFTGQIEVAAGTLNVRDLSASANNNGLASPIRGSIKLTNPNATLWGDGGFVDADIFLNNATGDAKSGALNSMVLVGDLYLGDQGAYLAGQSTGVQLRGAVYGGDLILPDDDSSGEVVFTNDRAAYTGETVIRDGEVELANGGRLSQTSRIIIHNDGQLFLNNLSSQISGQPPVAMNDRVADHIPVVMQGGAVRFWTPFEGAVSERIGTLDLERGSNVIAAQDPPFAPPSGTTTLTIGTLTRDPGATLFFDFDDPMTVRFDTPPVLDNGILGGWAIVNRLTGGQFVTDFATYSGNSIQALTGHVQNLATATAASNVLVAQNAQLPAGVTTVNSLTMRGSSDPVLNLGAQRLTVDSGGVLMTTGDIVNGELTSSAAVNELILLSSSGIPEIGANIVDSSVGGTGLTIGTGRFNANFILTGNNSYTGPTRINDDAWLEFHTFESMPTGGDLEINGGEAQLRFQSAVAKSLGIVTIRESGRLVEGHPAEVKLDIDEINLESGSIEEVELVGDTAIQKTTDGVATINSRNPLFTGSIDVYDGTLNIFGGQALGSASVAVHGGRLALLSEPHASLPPATIELNGGEFAIDSRFQGVVELNAPAKIIGIGFSNNASELGQIVGAHPVTLATDGNRLNLATPSPNFTGDVTIEGVVVARHAGAFGMGQVTVTTGGLLELGIPGNAALPNSIVLDGGELSVALEFGFEPIHANLQHVAVQGQSRIATHFRDYVFIAGPLELRDGSRLEKLGEGVLAVNGDLLVGETTQFVLGPGFLRTNDLDAVIEYLSEVHVSGVIKSNAAHASVDFVRTGFDKLVMTASVHVEAGQTLEILQNGSPMEFVVGSGETITGGGTFVNPILVDGGDISPGQSPGLLTFSAGLTIGAGSLYAWEINNATGAAGQSSGWDLLSVSGELNLDATAANPFVVHITPLDGALPGTIPNFDPHGRYRWLIASADTITGFDPAEIALEFDESFDQNPDFNPANFLLRRNGGDLYVVYTQVPEPNVAFLTFTACIVLPSIMARRLHDNGERTRLGKFRRA